MPGIWKDDAPVELREAGIEARGTRVGDMNVGFETWPPGDYTPLFRGLPGDACACGHFGYVVRGRARVTTPEGTETVEAGQAYHIPPGHTFEVLETFEIVEFTPVDERYEDTMAAFKRNFPAWKAAREAAAGGAKAR